MSALVTALTVPVHAYAQSVLPVVVSFGPPKPVPDLTYGAENNSAPYVFVDQDDNPRGFAIDVLRDAARRSGLRIDVRVGLWPEILRELDSGAIDVTAMTQTRARLDRYTWIRQLSQLRSVIVFPDSRIDPPRSLADLSHETIAIMNKSVYHEVLAGLPEPPRLLPLSDTRSAIVAMKEGRATGVAANAITVHRGASELGMTRFTELPIKAHAYGFVVVKGREKIAAKLTAALADMAERGVILQYEERWLSLPQPPLGWRTVAPWVGGGVALVLAGIAAVLVWNTSLRRRVRERTVALEYAMQRLEASRAQAQQAQKMEAVGRLAGGVAHDFNNMLTVILGQTELALRQASGDGRLAASLAHIQRAAQHSAALTSQLLAFARRQTVMPRILDLNATVSGMLRMLRRLIGENIQLEFRPGASLDRVKIDPAQIDQILANLCVNARDAIAGAGTIAIETGDVTFDEAQCADQPGLRPGRYTRLAVSDDGCGMDREALDHIFEPFFTTKPLGEGTGLGLATVFGIVKQNGGFISVRSALHQGTTFEIYLPAVKAREDEAREPAALDSPRGHGETVLLVEDEPAVLEFGRDALRELGYTVLTASSPQQAIEIVESRSGAIDLLVTDVVMPEMDGRQLVEHLSSAVPDLKCLFVSGHTRNVIEHGGMLNQGVRFLQKPFSIGALAENVRSSLRNHEPAPGRVN